MSLAKKKQLKYSVTATENVQTERKQPIPDRTAGTAINKLAGNKSLDV